MLQKIYRLSKNWEYQNVYRKGRHYSSRFFGLNYLPNKFGFCRFGVVVSKKITKKAAERNLLKRRVREIVTELVKNSNTSFDVIVSAHPAAIDANFNDLKKELEENFKKIGLI